MKYFYKKVVYRTFGELNAIVNEVTDNGWDIYETISIENPMGDYMEAVILFIRDDETLPVLDLDELLSGGN